MTIGKLDQLSVAVFVPEDHYGSISLGDSAKFTTDSYPDLNFAGIVTQISDQAEFTSSIDQTEEERQTTVYSIELPIANPDIQLIPGMPIQISFD